MKTKYNYSVTFTTESNNPQSLASKCFAFITLGEAYDFAKTVNGRIDGPRGAITWTEAAKADNESEANAE